ncbi:hypothetical protein EOM09_04490 [bacterium]|nr:hypothetical protein [bacterium]
MKVKIKYKFNPLNGNGAITTYYIQSFSDDFVLDVYKAYFIALRDLGVKLGKNNSLLLDIINIEHEGVKNEF